MPDSPDLAAIRARHALCTVGSDCPLGRATGADHCGECGQLWPCDATRLLPLAKLGATLTVERLDAALVNHRHDQGAPLAIRRDHLQVVTFRSCAAAIIAALRESQP